MDYIANDKNPPPPPPSTCWPLTNHYRKSSVDGSVSLGSLWDPAGGWFGEMRLPWVLRTLDPMCPGTIFSVQTAGRDSSLGNCLVPWGMNTVSQTTGLRDMYNQPVGHGWLQFGITRACLKITFHIPLLSHLPPQDRFYCQMFNGKKSLSVFFC